MKYSVAVAISDADAARIRGWCEKRSPQNSKSELVIEPEFDGDDAHVLERRAPWQPDGQWSSLRAATLHYEPSGMTWALRAYDSDERSRPYTRRGLGTSLDDVLDELDDDPTGLFWG